ncbi:MAG: flagellar biosynthesis regulator FlaF [Neomegalonema sp.]|nr:flagellar biosynthesis regulator FlaF [Neomegalonema sp.]
MYASQHAATGYAQTSRAVGTPRSLEYQIFHRVTAKLSAIKAEKNPSTSALAEAVAGNSKLWIALASDLMSDGNALPEQMRAQLISLAEFSRKHGSAVLRGKADVSALIEINTAIMRGLRTSANNLD